ncbi:ABC transporter substrate-binding protein [Microlunatus sp. Gsoil 973]|uniref:ABC transporter substrate-binding protein n=1 Tax=Microlunatus sp. Gsoil 973 TaxID=2672569 RepID=UPI0018A8724A|nr:extracellular solute-binding protein [Microlunatus sp. Gsoil 973]
MASPRSGWTRRSFLGIGSAGLAAALVGCSGASGSKGSTTKATIRAAFYGGDPVLAGLKQAFDTYTTKHQGVTITPELTPFGDYWSKLSTQVAGRNAPDVLRMSMSYFADYAQRGALLDLTDKIGSGIKISELDKDVASSGKIADQTYGIGQSSISHAVFTRPELWEKAKVDAPPADWTWDSFAEWAKGFASEAGSGTYGTTDAGGNLQIFEPFARQHGHDLFSADGKALAVPADVVEEWLGYWDGLRRAKAAPPLDVSAEAGDFDTNLMTKGRAPLTFGWVQQITFYAPLIDASVDIAALPSAKAGSVEGQFIKALDFWSISAQSRNIDASVALVDFLINDPAAIKAIGLNLGVPPSEAARRALGSDPKSAEGKAIGYVERIKDRVGPPPGAWPKGYGDLLQSFARLNEDVGFGKSNPAKAAAGFVEGARKSLAG